MSTYRALRAGIVGFVLMILFQCHPMFTLSLRRLFRLYEIWDEIPFSIACVALAAHFLILAPIVLAMVVAIGSGIWAWYRIERLQ